MIHQGFKVIQGLTMSTISLVKYIGLLFSTCTADLTVHVYTLILGLSADWWSDHSLAVSARRRERELVHTNTSWEGSTTEMGAQPQQGNILNGKCHLVM